MVTSSTPLSRIRSFGLIIWPKLDNIILLFHNGVTSIRIIDKCDKIDTSQKQLDGNYPGRQEAMNHGKQVGAIAGVIEIVYYTFEVSETRGKRGAGTQKKTGCLVSKRISTRLGCDVDRQ